ncbi:MAG: pyridoxamine 5'-phosphate oxidase family protein [Desulfobacterales bacterium]|jgi:hypothetical protein
MTLAEYFTTRKGIGVLATADADGHVDAAVYSRPHFMEDGTLAFIMRNRLTHDNLNSNPHATYLFIEEGNGYKGKRLFLRKVREEKESERLYELRRRSYPSDKNPEEDPKFLVFFELERTLPLLGDGENPSQ